MGVSGGGGTFCPSSSSSEPCKVKQWRDSERGQEATSLQLSLVALRVARSLGSCQPVSTC